MKNSLKDLCAFLLILSAVAIISNFSCGQQPNHPKATQLVFTQTSGISGLPQFTPGPFQCSVGQGAGNIVLQTQGLPGQWYCTFYANRAPFPGFLFIQSGIVDLDMYASCFEALFCNQLPYTNGFGAVGVSIPYSHANGFNCTVQSCVTDPTFPGGIRLTSAIHIVR